MHVLQKPCELFDRRLVQTVVEAYTVKMDMKVNYVD